MRQGAGPVVREVSPSDAWEMLSQDDRAVLVDVRTDAEREFVGGPDLRGLGRDVLHVAWKTWPGMTPNPGFVGALMDEAVALPPRMLFLCRSGARSMQAARAVADALSAKGETVECVNVAEGFEGDLDGLHHRGGLNGWKARGLAWRQS